MHRFSHFCTVFPILYRNFTFLTRKVILSLCVAISYHNLHISSFHQYLHCQKAFPSLFSHFWANLWLDYVQISLTEAKRSMVKSKEGEDSPLIWFQMIVMYYGHPWLTDKRSFWWGIDFHGFLGISIRRFGPTFWGSKIWKRKNLCTKIHLGQLGFLPPKGIGKRVNWSKKYA